MNDIEMHESPKAADLKAWHWSQM